MTVGAARRLIGVAALFSGAALLGHILLDVPLRLTLAVSTLALGLALGIIWRLLEPAGRAHLRRVARAGIIAGVLATIAYDASKFALSQLDPSPYNPFEAIRAFGALLVGPDAPPGLLIGAGTAFHALNGIAFGIAFCLLFGRRGVLAGIVWGIGLELFQLSLYPGWLDVRFYDEFRLISSLGHLVYGAVLGLLCRRLLAQNAASGAVE